MKVVVIGNPVDGIELVGPFEDQDQIDAYIESIRDTEFWVTDMEPPPPFTRSQPESKRTSVLLIRYRKWFDAGPDGYENLFGYQIVHGGVRARVAPFESAEERSQWQRRVAKILELNPGRAMPATAYLLLILMALDEDEARLGGRLLGELVGPAKAKALAALRS